jgi:hypothetical protein
MCSLQASGCVNTSHVDDVAVLARIGGIRIQAWYAHRAAAARPAQADRDECLLVMHVAFTGACFGSHSPVSLGGKQAYAALPNNKQRKQVGDDFW